MTRLPRVFSSHAVSVDGYVTGRGSGTGRGLGDGTVLFDWYFSGDTPSSIFDGFAMSAPSARVFDAQAARVGAVVCGRTTYDDSGWAAGRPFFASLPDHVGLRLTDAVVAPGVTHLHYDVVR